MILSYAQLETLKVKAISWASQFDVYLILDNHFADNAKGLGTIEFVLAAGVKSELQSHTNSFEELKRYIDSHHQWLFGFMTYDLKNQVEKLSSGNADSIQFPPLYFFQPQQLLIIDKEGKCIIGEDVAESILASEQEAKKANKSVALKPRVSKEQYLQDVQAIRKHIIDGDVYELNYCVEFYAEQVEIDPYEVYDRLRRKSAVPFGGMLRFYDQYLLCASPERFIKKQKDKLYSQPIKGTARRGVDESQDLLFREELLYSEKERAENLMIVDLVRNDLARSSQTGSVKVEELFGIYSFPQVHQMISTISSTIREDIHPVDAIKNAFPMGSMTGAPKIKAMQLIEQYEQTKRGLYSGSIGYFTPDGDFDFNVVIRSIQYNANNKYLSFEVGSAITFDSDPEKEYEECLLKAKAMFEVLTESTQ